ncbi:hypothetical protein K402DRAFT_403755 [Aulographum hederae CBS 113979]|uniref:Uncharacterized protein n=1 Tax=Aulographum hederae CBS 113979 TaxID=1176131 RepID=A0A6G1H236_9PEZI|nr:hypothetical protein K402DRAFT_403755 [Aulographum hederae CBS 113979]
MSILMSSPRSPCQTFESRAMPVTCASSSLFSILPPQKPSCSTFTQLDPKTSFTHPCPSASPPRSASNRHLKLQQDLHGAQTAMWPLLDPSRRHPYVRGGLELELAIATYLKPTAAAAAAGDDSARRKAASRRGVVQLWVWIWDLAANLACGSCQIPQSFSAPPMA